MGRPFLTKIRVRSINITAADNSRYSDNNGECTDAGCIEKASFSAGKFFDRNSLETPGERDERYFPKR